MANQAHGQYQNSQAYNNSLNSNEYIVKNTGSLQVKKTLISLKGISAGISIQFDLCYSLGTSGLLGLPDNWAFDLPYIIPNKSLTCHGQTSAIDWNWTDSAGHKSGLKYANGRALKLSQFMPDQPLPSGEPGRYHYLLQYSDGSKDYFDATGKLVEHSDLWGNYLRYEYSNDISGPLDNRLRRIKDSFGQQTVFSYNPSYISITGPDNGVSKIEFKSGGVTRVFDPLGLVTTFTYATVCGQNVISTISYPTGLKTQLTYTHITSRTQQGDVQLPAVSEFCYLGQGGELMARTTYAYGLGSGGATFTGATAGYQMLAGGDTLMEKYDPLFQYDVMIRKYDANKNLLFASQIFYNAFHLPLREEYYTIGQNNSLKKTYRAKNYYSIDTNQRARSNNFDKPVMVEQFVYDAATDTYLPLRKAESAFDDYGQPTQLKEYMYDRATQQYIPQTTLSSSYTPTSWGGEMPLQECLEDHVDQTKHITKYTLTNDQTNLASETLFFGPAGTEPSPTKTCLYSYDARGRSTGKTITWANGAVKSGRIDQSSIKIAYDYSPDRGIFTETTTDPLGQITVEEYAVTLPGCPLSKSTNSLGESTVHTYDLLGRQIQQTDAEGRVSSWHYKMAQPQGTRVVNMLLSTGPDGYATETHYDCLGRECEMRDQGVGKQLSVRCLRKTSYTCIGHIRQQSNELGLTHTYRYDALGRLLEDADPLGNVVTTEYQDAALRSIVYLNGVKQKETYQDGLGRVVKEIQFPNEKPSSLPAKVVINRYNGRGQSTSQVFAESKDDGVSYQPLNETLWIYDADGQVCQSNFVSYGQDQVKLERLQRYDLLGNPISWLKKVNYADGRSYTHYGPEYIYNAASQLVTTINQLGAREERAYDRAGRLISLRRFDGSLISYGFDHCGRLTSTSTPDGGVQNTYYPNDRIKSVSDGHNTLTYAYYRDGTAQSVSYADGRQQYYETDAFSRVVRETSPSGSWISRTFDQFGHVSTLQSASCRIEYVYGAARNCQNVLLQENIYGQEHLTRSWQYDPFGLASTIESRQGQTLLLGSYLQHDSLGRLISLRVASDKYGQAALNQSRSIHYDGFHQVSTVVAQYADQRQVYTYSYDGNSNILSRSKDLVCDHFSYNSLNQLDHPDYSYDLNGRLLTDQRGQRGYSYNHLDQLVAINDGQGCPIIQYQYYPDGAMSSRQAKSVAQFYYSGGAVNCLYQPAEKDQVWSDYLLTNNGRLAVFSEDKLRALLLPAAGSTMLIMPSGQNPIVLDYDPYGQLAASADLPLPFCFNWQQEYAEPAEKMVYLRSRFYHPQHMRFMSMDRKPLDNQYAYCQGDPLNLIDPEGTMSGREIAGLVLGAVVGIGVTLATGGIAGVGAACVFGSECVLASVGVSALAGAAGSLAGTVTNGLVGGNGITVPDILLSVAVGGLSGGAGALVGGAAGRASMRLAMQCKLSARTVTCIGTICSGGAGGLAGAFSGAGVQSALTGQPLFSVDTALSMTVGGVVGFCGGFLTSGAYLGLMNKKVLPVPLHDNELALIKPAVNQTGKTLSKKLLVMAPAQEADTSAKEFANFPKGIDSALTLNPQSVDTLTTFDTIAAHGMGNTLMASVTYKNEVVMRPIKCSRFAEYLISMKEGWNESKGAIKLMSCFGGYRNAQTLADALQRPVYAGYSAIDRYTFTDWVKFTPSK